MHLGSACLISATTCLAKWQKQANNNAQKTISLIYTDAIFAPWQADLKFVATITTCGRAKYFQLCNFFLKTTRFLAKFAYKYEIYPFI